MGSQKSLKPGSQDNAHRTPVTITTLDPMGETMNGADMSLTEGERRAFK